MVAFQPYPRASVVIFAESRSKWRNWRKSNASPEEETRVRNFTEKTRLDETPRCLAKSRPIIDEVARVMGVNPLRDAVMENI